MKIQPISNNTSYDTYRQSRNIQWSPVADKSLLNDTGMVDLLEINAKQNEVQNNLLKLGIGILGAGMLAIAGSLLMPKGGSSTRSTIKIFTKTFESLGESKDVPTLDTCKSLNSKLRNFLKTQLKLAKSTPEELKALGNPKPANRLILYGPPGVGKSYYAKIYAKSLDAEYLEVKYSDINSEWCGDQLEQLNNIFKQVLLAGTENPNKKYVLVLNEIDPLVVPLDVLLKGRGHSIFKTEERSIFLDCIDEIAEKAPNVTIIGTTNVAPRDNKLDGAAMSRFKNILAVGYPEKDCLLEALKSSLQKFDLEKDFVDKNADKLNALAEKMAKRKASFRDLNKMLESSKLVFMEDSGKAKNKKFDVKYLDEAFDSIELTDGEITP